MDEVLRWGPLTRSSDEVLRLCSCLEAVWEVHASSAQLRCPIWRACPCLGYCDRAPQIWTPGCQVLPACPSLQISAPTWVKDIEFHVVSPLGSPCVSPSYGDSRGQVGRRRCRGCSLHRYARRQPGRIACHGGLPCRQSEKNNLICRDASVRNLWNV